MIKRHPDLVLSKEGVEEGMPQELEILAAAGYCFNEGFAEEIQFAEGGEGMFYQGECTYGDGPFILSPKRGSKLLLMRDFFHVVKTVDIAQTDIPGVIEIVTHPSRTPFDHQFYRVHMSSDTTPKDIPWSTINLKKYNQLRHDHYRSESILS